MVRLISDTYQKLNYELHKTDPRYGAKAAKHAADIADIIRRTGARSLLDYGCGKGTLKPALQALCPSLDIREYDPCVPGKTAKPRPADIVVCLDVMEHIEPDRLDDVLAHIRSVTGFYAFMTVAVSPARKTLPDGRNAHLIVQPREWWTEQLARHFAVKAVEDFGQHWFRALLTRPT